MYSKLFNYRYDCNGNRYKNYSGKRPIGRFPGVVLVVAFVDYSGQRPIGRLPGVAFLHS